MSSFKKMDDLILKFNQLNQYSQKQLLDFLDFLLGKQQKRQSGLNMDEYRKKLMQVSFWSDAEIKEIEQNSKKFNWKPEEW